ncbi:hypothetical protein D9M73_165100 [compost metagenome]
MAVGVGVHEQRQRLVGLRIVHGGVVDATGQRPAHQHLGAVAHPVAHCLQASRWAPQFEQHAVHGGGQVWH